MDRLPVLRRIRAEQARRDARAADLHRQADQLGKRVDEHAKRVLKDYRRYGDAMHR